MRPDYDFRGGRRGRHAAAYSAGTNLIRVDHDIAKQLSPCEINRILRDHLRVIEGSARELGSVEPKKASAQGVFLLKRSDAGKWQVIGLPEMLSRKPMIGESHIGSFVTRIGGGHEVPMWPLMHMWHTLFPTDDTVEISELPAGVDDESPFDLFWRNK